MIRDLNRVLAFIIREIIPADEEHIINQLDRLYRKTFYVPLEEQLPYHWQFAGQELDRILGDPLTSTWKQRVQNVFASKEKIPDDFLELGGV